MNNISFYNQISEANKKPFEKVIEMEAGSSILNENDKCESVLFLLSGEIEVFKVGSNGRKFSLYTIRSGESCVLNLSCILSNTKYLAYAKAKTDIKCVLIPKNRFLELFNTEEAVKAYVFNLISNRLIYITEKVENIVLVPLENRLRALLLKDNNRVIYTTHDQIANILGTAREVISRQLKKWEKDGKIELYRGKIVILEL